MNDVVKNLFSVRFGSDNQYRYFQDHCFYRGIPDNVDFYPTEEIGNGSMVFIGDGHGIQKKHGIVGEYGNGSIFVRIDDIPHLVEQCRANFLSNIA